MPMPKKVHDVLSEKLSDAKVTIDGEETLFVDYIEALFDKADAAVKIQTANAEISKGREKAEANVKDLKKKLEDLSVAQKEKEDEIKRLQDSMLSDDDKKKLDDLKRSGGITREAEAKINALAAQVEEAQKATEELTKKYEQERDEKIAAEASGRKERLRSDITTALGKVGIVGENSRIALNDILAESMVSDTETGRAYTVLKDGKICSVETIDELASHYASVNENLVRSSGNSGPGQTHTSAVGNAKVDMSYQDLETQARQMIGME